MPQRRKQQKGAGILDFLSSDPAKQIETNNTRIGELEKESEQKCADLKKKNDLKIADLKKKNEELQKAADAKKAEVVKEAESGFSFSKITDLFGSKSAADAPAAGPATGPATGSAAGPAAGPAAKESNFGRMFGGNKKSKRRRGSRARKSIKK